MVVVAELVEGQPLLMGPMETNQLAFGEVEGLELGGLVPVKIPAWLGGGLELESQSAEYFVGKKILYRWPSRLGGWAVGTVTRHSCQHGQEEED